MDKSELDLIFKVQLFAHRNNGTGVDAKKTQRQRKRENNAINLFSMVTKYRYVEKTFLFAHAILANPSWNPYQSH
jgi:hypothetical protein